MVKMEGGSSLAIGCSSRCWARVTSVAVEAVAAPWLLAEVRPPMFGAATDGPEETPLVEPETWMFEAFRTVVAAMF